MKPDPVDSSSASGEAGALGSDCVKLRALFESYIKREHDCPPFASNFWLLERRNGDYMHGTTYFAWENWKAASAALGRG